MVGLAKLALVIASFYSGSDYLKKYFIVLVKSVSLISYLNKGSVKNVEL